MADAKQQLMSQIQQQAALSNARALVEVSTVTRPPPSLSHTPIVLTTDHLAVLV
jgi:hypothetical protein